MCFSACSFFPEWKKEKEASSFFFFFNFPFLFSFFTWKWVGAQSLEVVEPVSLPLPLNVQTDGIEDGANWMSASYALEKWLVFFSHFLVFFLIIM